MNKRTSHWKLFSHTVISSWVSLLLTSKQQARFPLLFVKLKNKWRDGVTVNAIQEMASVLSFGPCPQRCPIDYSLEGLSWWFLFRPFSCEYTAAVPSLPCTALVMGVSPCFCSSPFHDLDARYSAKYKINFITIKLKILFSITVTLLMVMNHDHQWSDHQPWRMICSVLFT